MKSRNPRFGVVSTEIYDDVFFKLRLGDPLSLLAGVIDTYFYKIIEEHRFQGDYAFESDEHFVDAMDAFIIQRWGVTDDQLPLIQLMISSGKPIILELDDWLLGLPQDHAQYQTYIGRIKHLETLLPDCALVTVSTPVLAEKIRSINNNVVIIENAISQQRIVEPKPRDKMVTIGFAGTSEHRKGLELISQALLRIYNEYAGMVRFVFFGAVPSNMVGLKEVTAHTDWVNYHDYLKTLAEINIDIGLAPLKDDAFNQCKSDIKWLDYSIVGAATIASNLLPYAKLQDQGLALLVDNDDAEAWYQALTTLLDDDIKRQQLANKSREYVLAHRLLENNIGQYIAAWNQVLPADVKIKPPVILGRPEQQVSCAQDPKDVQAALRYKQWKVNSQPRETHVEVFAERMMTVWDTKPVFNLIVLAPEAQKRQLVTSLTAMEKQLYPHWRFLVLADWEMPDAVFANSPQLAWLQLDTLEDAEQVANTINHIAADVPADWMMLLPAGFRLEPQALLRLGEAIHAHPEWMAIYTDSDIVSPMGEYFSPAFKPDFALEYLRSMDYIGSAVAVSTRALVALNGVQPYPGAYLYDFLLRLFELSGVTAIGHLDTVLVSLPYVAEVPALTMAARKVALESHALRMGLQVSVDDGYVSGTHHFNLAVQGAPLVSIIIPTRDKLELLQSCVISVLTKTDYQNFEIIIVDNHSEEPETWAFYQELKASYPDRVKVIEYNAPFNFSAQCNVGVEHAAGEFIVLLNNDTEVALSSWLGRLLALTQQEGAGVVGARLLYPEVGLIQHAGMVLGMAESAEHLFIGQAMSLPGYQNRALTSQNYSALTAACFCVRKAVYKEVGGFDEEHLAVLYGDVDFSLKVQGLGLRNIYTPFAVLYHDAKSSLKSASSDLRRSMLQQLRVLDEQQLFKQRWFNSLKRDPFYNRNLSLASNTMKPDWLRTPTWDPSMPGRKRVLGLPLVGGSGEYRVSMPLMVLQERGRMDGDIFQPSLGWLTEIEMGRYAPDTLLTSLVVQEAQWGKIEAYRSFIPQLRIVSSLDDLIGAVPEKSNLYDHWQRYFPDAKRRARKGLKLSDALVVSTEPLLAFARSMIDDVVVIPNRLRKTVWQPLHSKRRVGAKPRVGWVGAMQHRGDLELILEVIQQTANEVDWIFMGMCLPQFRPYVKEVIKPVPFGQYPEKMASLNLDLAIAPLEVNAFNEAKSNLRLLEYGALGWPVICTDIYPYQTNDAPVCRLPNDPALWVEAIRARVHDLDAAAQEGDALRAWVNQHYWLEEHHNDWFDVLHG